MSKQNINLLFAFGRPFAPLYGWLMSLRAAFYKKGVLKQHRLSVPVISVGNLTMGGTGKTPVTIYLGKLLADMSPVVVSRGYKSKNTGDVHMVSDGNRINSDVEFSGDEPVLISERLPGVPVLTSKKRSSAGQYAIDKFQAGIIVLDDGFQHLALCRDVNIALFKVDSFLGNNRIFPGGDMREPLKALQRADCFMLTCVDEENRERALAIRNALAKRFPGTPTFLSEYQSSAIVDHGGKNRDMSALSSQSLFAFCGLASPASFQRTLGRAGICIVGFKGFKDHHGYSVEELKKLVRDAKKAGAQALITTEKDMVKLKHMVCDFPLMALRMSVVPEEGFDNFVLEKLR
jgi:tetraacyldisaccharide 4'-kinase